MRAVNLRASLLFFQGENLGDEALRPVPHERDTERDKADSQQRGSSAGQLGAEVTEGSCNNGSEIRHFFPLSSELAGRRRRTASPNSA